MCRVLFFNFGDFSKKLLEDNMRFQRFVAMAMIFALSFSMQKNANAEFDFVRSRAWYELFEFSASIIAPGLKTTV